MAEGKTAHRPYICRGNLFADLYAEVDGEPHGAVDRTVTFTDRGSPPERPKGRP
jgi:hypothetical protein